MITGSVWRLISFRGHTRKVRWEKGYIHRWKVGSYSHFLIAFVLSTQSFSSSSPTAVCEKKDSKLTSYRVPDGEVGRSE